MFQKMYSHIDTVILDRLAKNCIRLYYYWISFSSNMKLGGGGGGGGVILIHPE